MKKQHPRTQHQAGQLQSATHDADWWCGAVIYQIYPRSFADSNGDGVGDLRGIVDKLPYLARLGVDALWISPFFKSPMKDFGYDVADYCDVDPLFGDLHDFDALLDAAHAAQLKVMIDQVLSHCSDQHPWFKESGASRHNAKADWFVWADALPDGSPPNNWLSVFGGSAWHWEPRRRQYYLHNFLSSQPDLNLHNMDVQDALLAAIRFWLQRGVDGFRFDACNFHFHDRKLRNNPPRGADRDDAPDRGNPYNYQRHKHDKSQPENLGFLRRIRALLNTYGAASVGEIGDEQGLKLMAQYTSGGDKLHMAYGFNLLSEDSSVHHIRHSVRELERHLDVREKKDGRRGWGCWSFGNHDVMRVLTRWAKDEMSTAQTRQYAKLLLALLGALAGSFCIYQGEELGLTEADIPFDLLQDPYGIAFWPDFPGRDGCRTPMPWLASAMNAGFSDAQPWLPLPAEHMACAADVQDTDEASVLNFYRKFLRWRRDKQALRRGDITFLKSDEPVLAFIRRYNRQKLLCVFNLSGTAVYYKLPGAVRSAIAIHGHGLNGARIDGKTVELAGYAGLFATI